MVLGVLLFSVAAFVTSYAVAKARVFDQGKLSAVIALIAWSSMMFGLFISRLAP
jgi:hypothetical protein